MMFWQKKNDTSKNIINSDEYERLAKRISDLSTETAAVKTKVELFETDLANLRGKFNQRLKGLKQEEEKVEQKEEEKVEETTGSQIAFG